MSELLTCIDLSKHYLEGENQVQVLKNVNFSIGRAEQVAILWRSRSGKSTLLHLLGALDKPSQGKVLFKDDNIVYYNDKQQALFRKQHLGFVYQFHHLLPEFSALENVAMPLLIGKVEAKVAFNKAADMLDKVGLSHRQTHNPSEVSGGERQSVAKGRAVVEEAELVLAGEPAGNLDHKTGKWD